MTTKMFGEPIARREDPRLVSGAGRYLDDLGPGALAAAFVRSPYAHARVLDVDVTDALDVDGLVAIYTYEDLDGRVAEPLPLLIPHPALHAPRTGYPLANGIVKHVGEPVVMVVAVDRYVAEDVCSLIRVSYEALPPVVGIDAAVAADHAVHSDVPDNVAAHLVQEVGDARAAIAAAPHRLRLDLRIERSASMPMEGKGVYARWDAADRSLRVYSSTQTSTSVRFALAAKLDIPVDRVEVVTPDVGGGFGVKIVHPWPEEVLVPWAARRLDREVKWTEDRYEHFVSSAHERGQKHTIEVGFDDAGRLLGLDVQFWHDNGAYTPYGIITPVITSTQLLGPYKPGAYRVEFWSLYTNTVIVTPYRGAGRPQGVFAMERTMDAIAAFLGLDRAAVRERNFIQPDEMPYDHRMTFQDGRPLIYDSGDYPAALEKVKKLVGWDEFEAYREQARLEGRRVGIGLACYVEGTGVGPYEGAFVRVETNGQVVVATGLTTQGQGHETVFAQIAADLWGVTLDKVSLVAGDTASIAFGCGTFGSRSTVNVGSAIYGASARLKEKVLRLAAHLLEANPDDLELGEGKVSIRGLPQRALSFSELARAAVPGWASKLPEGLEPGLEATFYFVPPTVTWANAAHLAVIEVEIDTGIIKLLDYVVAHDAGRLINPLLVDGQIHGGVAQGIGAALYEEIAYDQNGQLLSGSFVNYLLPGAMEVPNIKTVHLESPSPLNPLGVKGLGEGGAIAPPAAIANALADALVPFAPRVNEIPLTPDRVLQLLTRKEVNVEAGTV